MEEVLATQTGHGSGRDGSPAGMKGARARGCPRAQTPLSPAPRRRVARPRSPQLPSCNTGPLSLPLLPVDDRERDRGEPSSGRKCTPPGAPGPLPEAKFVMINLEPPPLFLIFPLSSLLFSVSLRKWKPRKRPPSIGHHAATTRAPSSALPRLVPWSPLHLALSSTLLQLLLKPPFLPSALGSCCQDPSLPVCLPFKKKTPSPPCFLPPRTERVPSLPLR